MPVSDFNLVKPLGLIRFFENFESILLHGQILNLAALPIDFGSRGSQGSTGHV
jgi:hypothetical protein